ncbi:peptidase inhibitor family I36 protein [Actinophytocola sp.]|uniref:peptidase inhibitor family I36 protein n=1 Tax=Actinophytocola sp. TaxID=1872138 RepID=UPI002ED41A81
MRRPHASRTLAAALAGLLLTGVTVALAPAAAAAGTCGYANTLCLWEEQRYGGASLTASPLGSGGVCVDLVQHGWGERARSVINTSRHTASLFASADCTGRPYPVDGNTSVPTLSFLANSVYVAK